MNSPPSGNSSPGPGVVVSTNASRGHYAADEFDSDAIALQRAYDDAVAGPTGGTLVLDPADRPFELDTPLEVWQSDCRITATGGPTLVPDQGYTGPLLTSGLREETDTGPDDLVSNVSVDNVWLDGRNRALGVRLDHLQLSTVGPLHVRNTDGPGLWLADFCIENLFRDLVLSDDCGSMAQPALLIEPDSEHPPDVPGGPDNIGNTTINSTHFSGIMIHFPGNEAVRIGSGPAPVNAGRRHRKFQFTGCMFHGHGRGTDPLVTLEDVRQAAFVGTQWLLWREEGVVVQFGSEGARHPVANTTVSHCRFVARPDSTATGIRCRNVESGATSLQAVGNSFERLAHAVDWGDQPDKRVAWAGNGVDVSGEPHVGVLPENADERPF